MYAEHTRTALDYYITGAVTLISHLHCRFVFVRRDLEPTSVSLLNHFNDRSRFQSGLRPFFAADTKPYGVVNGDRIRSFPVIRTAFAVRCRLQSSSHRVGYRRNGERITGREIGFSPGNDKSMLRGRVLLFILQLAS